MTWISLVCLLALSSSALGRHAYGGGYSGVSVPQVSRIFPSMREQVDPQPFLPTIQPVQTGGYGSSFEPQPLTRTLISSGYDNGVRSLDQLPPPPPPPQILTPADLLCRGQVAETVIPIENGRKFVVCLDESKGVELNCPKGLFYHQTSRRCERNLGPLENPCSSQPCLNGGQCIPTDSWYQCKCAAGFDGINCELDAHYCQQQQPCGQAPDTRCQSFRLGAALQWICLFQDGLAYGLGATQVQPSPCKGIDGPHPLAISDKGFIMCDGERTHIESCPGGTIWDDLNKACTWPDMQGVIGVPQRDQQDSYGQTRTLIAKPAYGGGYSEERTLIAKPAYGGGYGEEHHFEQKPMPRLIQVKSGYGGGYGGQEEFKPKSIHVKSSGYGGGYGAQEELRPTPRLIKVETSGGYGGQQEFRPQPVQVKQLVSSGY